MNWLGHVLTILLVPIVFWWLAKLYPAPEIEKEGPSLERAVARTLLEEFLAAGSVGRGYTALYKEAKRWLAADAREAKV